MGIFSKVSLTKAISKPLKKLGKSIEKGLRSGGQAGGLKKFKALNSRQYDMFKDMVNQFNPKALDIMHNPLYKRGQSYLKDFLKQSPEERFAPFEKQAMSQFNQEIVPDIAERFSALGAQGSSAFNQSMAGAGANLSERLAMLREQLKGDFENKQLNATQIGLNYAQQPTNDMFNLAQLGLGTQTIGYQNQQFQPNYLQRMVSGFSQGAGRAATSGGFG